MILKTASFLFILTSCKSSPVQNEEVLGAKIANLEHDVQETKTALVDLLTTVRQISQNFEAVSNTVETALSNMDSKVEHLKQDILDKLENKVKREQRAKFETDAKKITQTLAEDIAKSTITKDEFASFQLLVARDTCHVRVSQILLFLDWIKRHLYCSTRNDSGSFFREEVSTTTPGTILPETLMIMSRVSEIRVKSSGWALISSSD